MGQARYLKDFTIGETWESEPIAITTDDIIAYAQVNDPQPIRTDTEHTKAGPFGTVIASRFQIAALSTRMFIQAGDYEAAPVVGMGIGGLLWLKPVRLNDTLVVRRGLIGIKRLESRPDHGMPRPHAQSAIKTARP